MAILQQITLTFTKPIQVSVQKGDISYYTDDPMGENIVRMGKILSVTRGSPSVIVTEILSITPRPTSTSFILFTKDNKANTSGILGYYAEVEMRNDSRKKAELFSVGSEIFESSK